ncbi:MAG: hypothetical protein LBC51_01945 [Treponema sp.]|jgi:hypothetical protein|nr:hypothetical protein [Treponema sp.]
MIRSIGNHLFRILITGFTALAVLVSFCLAAVEPLRAAQFVAKRTDSTTASIDRCIPPATEEPALLTKTEGHEHTLLRSGFQRIFIHGEPHKLASSFCLSPFVVISPIKTLDVKHTILLKLRI